MYPANRVACVMVVTWQQLQEEFEDTKVIIRNSKYKDRQRNDQNKNDKQRFTKHYT
jgi:hypothetical protein